MAVEPLRSIDSEYGLNGQNSTRSTAELTLVPTLAEQVALENEIAVSPEDIKRKTMQIARELCIEPGVKNAAAWEYMTVLLRNQFTESTENTFKTTDPEQGTSRVRTGDVVHAYYVRRRQSFVRRAEALGISPEKAAKKALRDELGRYTKAIDQMKNYYSASHLTNKDNKNYFEFVDGVFASSPHEQKAAKMLGKRK